MSEIRVKLNEHLNDVNEFAKNDPLCNLDAIETLDFSSFMERIDQTLSLFKKSQKIEKETGINPLCKSIGVIHLKISNEITYRTPIFLQEIHLKKSEVSFEIEEIGNFFLNPYLIFSLQIKNQEIQSFEDFRKIIPTNFEIEEDLIFLGNFHPYRFEIFRDLSEIIKVNRISPDLGKLLMIEHPELELQFSAENVSIQAMDFDQKNTLNLLKLQSLLVQGPPGTGKSQLICNAICQALSNNFSVLISSEKKASLDAVFGRLKSNGLDKFCLVNYAKNEHKSIISDLKKTWDYLNKNRTAKQLKFEDNFLFKSLLEELILSPKIEFLSLNEFVSSIGETNFSFVDNKVTFDEFQSIENKINLLSADNFSSMVKLNFNEDWDGSKILNRISDCFELIKKLENYHPIKSKKDFDQLIRNLGIIERFTSGIFNQYGKLIITKAKVVKRIYLEHLKLEKNELKWRNKLDHWKKIPTIQELELLRKYAAEKSIQMRIRFKFMWKKWVRTTDLDPIKICDETLAFLKFQQEKEKHNLVLKELGIDSVNDLKLIYDLSLKTLSEDWEWFTKLDTNLIKDYKNIHLTLSTLKSNLERFFNFNETDDISEYFNSIVTNREKILSEILIIESFPKSARDLLQKCNSISEFKQNVYLANWKKNFKHVMPPSSKQQKEWINSALNYEKNKKQNFKFHSNNILEKIKSEFEGYHSLIDTPNRKLSIEDQKLKNELKKGKNILVKEFGKSKQFRGLRELYESDARKWVMLLKPILMMHPNRIATYFPPEPGLFDLGIIDEASQMPFKNSIGTLQRVKRILIAGDENQMSPSSFFKSNTNDHSAFHQAKYHFTNASLNHHYRSESEELISFSNRYFYENNLRFIERARESKEQVLFHHLVTKGEYHDGINEKEAIDVSNFITKILSQEKLDLSFGIVAFSEAQLHCIQKKLSPSALNIIEDLIEKDQFFLKSLDQVQGDECDVLIISFGYAKNKEGKFEMRFGPINQNDGDKRLNVLFSRAKKEIHFFSSVQYKDFPISKNEGVNLLKNWFSMLEESQNFMQKKYEINVFDILEKARDVDDFTHLISIYHERGWKILTT